MIEGLPLMINVLFLFTVLICIAFFHFSNSRPKGVTLFIILWSGLHAALAYSGFYTNTRILPPRFVFVILPSAVLVTFGCFQTAWFTSVRNTRISTFLHTVRIPVELLLHALFLHHMVPELLTYEGRNFDILAGISAPIIGILFAKEMLGRKALIAWNFIALALVLFVFINGVLSSELPFQQFAFDQPNRAMLYFPFVLLPATIVPIVVYTHITDILVLLKATNQSY